MRRAAIVIILIFGCAGCLTGRDSVDMPEAYERPEWVDKEVWKEKGKIYAVGVQKKSKASVGNEPSDAEIYARERIARFLNVCQVTLIAYSTLRQWNDRDGASYILIRVDEYIAWEKCPSTSVYRLMDFSSGFFISRYH